jgi:hypothetical protein
MGIHAGSVGMFCGARVLRNVSVCLAENASTRVRAKKDLWLVCALTCRCFGLETFVQCFCRFVGDVPEFARS